MTYFDHTHNRNIKETVFSNSEHIMCSKDTYCAHYNAFVLSEYSVYVIRFREIVKKALAFGKMGKKKKTKKI